MSTHDCSHQIRVLTSHKVTIARLIKKGGDTPNGICLISYPQTRGHFLARTNFLSSLELTIGAKQNEDIMNEQFDLKPKEELYIY
jgi:hypothetical protein